MSMKALSRLWPLAFVIATTFIVVEATIALGQINQSEEIDPFADPIPDTPATKSSATKNSATKNKSRPANLSSTTDQNGGNQLGKYYLNQTGRAPLQAPLQTGQTKSISGVDPKAPTVGKAATSNAKKPAGTMGNTMSAARWNPAAPKATPSPQVLPAAVNPSQALPGGATSPMTGSTGESSAPALAAPNQSKRVTPVAHYGPTDVVDRDGGDATIRKQQRMPLQPVITTNPGEQNGPPGVRGALFGLNGLTATERLYQLQNNLAELQRENEELRRDNANIMARFKESQDQLLAGAREIQLARKELAAARGDLERLRGDLQTLREKVRLAEKEHSAVLQTIGPILQQLLEADEVSALPPNPVERD